MSFLKTEIPRWVIFGVLAVILLYVSVAGVISTTSEWGPSSDTRQHVDYIWRLHNGDIPKRSQGIQYPPFVEQLDGSFKPQAASANPPLFYLIHAPFTGPLLNAGEWQKAIAVGRTINILLGILCVLVLAWAGWVFGGRRKELFAVAVPAMAVLSYRFLSLNVEYALDALLVLFSTLTFITLHKMMTNGIKAKYVIALAALSVMGMATKAPYIVILAASLLAIVVASIIHGSRGWLKDALRGALMSAGILVVVAIAIGWFYYFWNYSVNGSWFTARPDDFTGGREHKSLWYVVTSTDLWGLLFTGYARIVSISVAVTVFAAAGILTTKKTVISKISRSYKQTALLLTLLLAFLGTFMTQIEHAAGYGAFNYRYMLPAILPIGLFLAYGLLQYAWTRGQMVSLAAITMCLSTLFYVAGVAGQRVLAPEVLKAKDNLAKLLAATSENGIPSFVTVLLLVTFLSGAVLLSISLFKLTARQG